MARYSSAEVEQKLRALLMEIDKNAWEIGELLADSFLTDTELFKLAETLGVSLQTLTEYRHTVQVLRKPIAGVSFAIMAELARVSDPTTREEIWHSRAHGEWTLLDLKNAVDQALRRKPKVSSTSRSRSRTAMAAEADGRKVRVILTVSEEGVTLDLEPSEEIDFTKVEISREQESWRHIYPWFKK